MPPRWHWARRSSSSAGCPTASVARRSSGGCLLAAITYIPIFGLTHFANPAIEEARSSSPALVVADPATCSFQFDPVGLRKFTSSCDVAPPR